MVDQQKVRLFVAVELPEGVRHALGGAIARLRERDLGELRWASPDGIHLTLKFLGDVEATRVAELQAALAPAASGHTSFTLRLANGGVFPNAKGPRVVWVGLDGDLESLMSLQRDVEQALAGVGFPPEARAFQAHLTLARLRDRLDSTERSRLMESLETLWEVEPPEFQVRSLSLMQSTLEPTGAEYTRLGEVGLVG